MRDITKRRLQNFEGRGTLPLRGGGALLLGALFAGVGAIPLAIGLGIWAFGSKPTNPPGWIIATFGLVFVVFGVGAIWSGLSGMYRLKRARRAYFAGSRSPWDWDHPWNRTGARDDVWKRVARRIVALAFIGLFLVPFHFLVITIDDTTVRVVGGIFLTIFDVVLIVSFVSLVRTIAQGLKYGRVFLQYEQFPMLLGRKAAVRLVLDRPVQAPSIDCKVRYIAETVEISRQSGGRNTRQYVVDQLYEETITVPLGPGAAGGQSARIEIELPSGDYATRLSVDEPRYWLLEADASTPGVDFHARFLLPVYAPEMDGWATEMAPVSAP